MLWPHLRKTKLHHLSVGVDDVELDQHHAVVVRLSRPDSGGQRTPVQHGPGPSQPQPPQAQGIAVADRIENRPPRDGHGAQSMEDDIGKTTGACHFRVEVDGVAIQRCVGVPMGLIGGDPPCAYMRRRPRTLHPQRRRALARAHRRNHLPTNVETRACLDGQLIVDKPINRPSTNSPLDFCSTWVSPRRCMTSPTRTG